MEKSLNCIFEFLWEPYRVMFLYHILFSALVSVSEEVRSRCHLKHRTSQYMMTDSPSSDSLSAEMSQPATNPGKHSYHACLYGWGEQMPSQT